MKIWTIYTCTMPNGTQFDCEIYDIKWSLIALKILTWVNKWMYSFIRKDQIDDTMVISSSSPSEEV